MSMKRRSGQQSNKDQHQRTDGQIGGQTNGQTDGRTDGRADGRTDGRTDERENSLLGRRFWLETRLNELPNATKWTDTKYIVARAGWPKPK